ncbi:MAG: hypothetical protein KDA49_02400 [Rhodospirillaceae bacterium]|nr:hypothetical protein [Rhodospirillaceae bacterium]
MRTMWVRWQILIIVGTILGAPVGGMLLFSGNIAGTHLAILERLPPTLHVDRFSRFYTSFNRRCTVAEIQVSENSHIPEDFVQSTVRAFADMNELTERRRLIFPESGFAVFPNTSLLQVVSIFELSEMPGDGSVGRMIGDTIFSARDCWRDLLGQTRQSPNVFFQLFHDQAATVLIGGDPRAMTILFFPDRHVVYYLGP